MIIETQHIYIEEDYLAEAGIDTERCILFDIETTGFKASTSQLYLIGAAKREGDHWLGVQWFAEGPDDQTAILQAFSAFTEGFDTIVHFNGDRFDIPYMEEKYAYYALSSPFTDRISVDLFRKFRSVKKFLELTHMNQKALEKFLGLDRDDQFDGGALIQVYRAWQLDHDPIKLKLLMLHNAEDVSGMFTLSRMYGYVLALDTVPAADSIIRDIVSRSDGSRMLRLQWPLSASIPVPVTRMKDLCVVRLEDRTATLLVPIFDGMLRHFFPDYRNYYYLPEEDTAVHKSVSSYVGKEFRQQAKADNCYIRKEGSFLPQLTEEFTPAFRWELKDSYSWFEVPDGDDFNETFCSQYCVALLAYLKNA